MRVAIDTNILAYAEGVNGGARKKAALATLQRKFRIQDAR
jgi:predicted nucleic acid-binding protein